MIVSRTPFRVSLAGGGTDLARYYRKRPGAVLSTAIDKYMYIAVHRYFDDRIMLKYSETELVPDLSKVRHPLLREGLKMAGIRRGIEIASMADIPGGTGLGSSSSFSVGLLNALHYYLNRPVPAEVLAQEACRLEIEKLKEPIGKQDQYIAAYGGFQFFEFMPDESVRVTPLNISAQTRAALWDRLLLLFTGVTRRTKPLLRSVNRNFSSKWPLMDALRDLAHAARADLQTGNVSRLGDILHEGWEIKKRLADGITNPEIDRAYALARKHGAAGGKILGAGGGGFLLLFVEPRRRAAVLRALRGWRQIPFGYEAEGSRIIHVS